MKITYLLISLMILISCNSGKSQNQNDKMIDQKELANPKVQKYQFLDCMYKDSYFPEFLVDKCKSILLHLCKSIEVEEPKSLDELYLLTHKATEELNKLQDEFFQNDSEIETGARECLGANFEFIAKAYGFNADIEELIAPRDW